MSATTDDELVRNMFALQEGLEKIANMYGEHVMLASEDPITFGAGHFVLYPQEGSSPRFVIEEQYTGTDWSDPDRVATSWTWQSEARLPPPDGHHQWVSLGDGEVASADVRQLLERAEGWAKTIHDLAVREEALTAEPLNSKGTGREGEQRTFLT